MVRLLEERDGTTGAKTLTFDQLPLLVMPDGTKVVQTAGLIRCIGRTFAMYGDSDAEATRIDVLLGGIGDFGNKCPGWPSPDARAGLPKTLADLESKWLERYAGAFEQQLSAVSMRPNYTRQVHVLDAPLTARCCVRPTGRQQRFSCRQKNLCRRYDTLALHRGAERLVWGGKDRPNVGAVPEAVRVAFEDEE
jgi:hypothetical protein